MEDPIQQRMARLQILEKDLEERFVLGSGSGGQKINKTANCVYLKHLPSGVEVTCQESRSREKNREIARRRLCEHFERIALQKRHQSARNRALNRYRKRRPSKATKAKMRKDKSFRSDKKKMRGRVRI